MGKNRRERVTGRSAERRQLAMAGNREEGAVRISHTVDASVVPGTRSGEVLVTFATDDPPSPYNGALLTAFTQEDPSCSLAHTPAACSSEDTGSFCQGSNHNHRCCGSSAEKMLLCALPRAFWPSWNQAAPQSSVHRLDPEPRLPPTHPAQALAL
uniref:Uncharacterized protein n=1 Tax=Molossus molossus TaxID=27622 RepID=A0A7J8GLW1_MOLMO|nr:hypothetical protein HJG59_011491 [Molossus molossus]